MDVVMTLTMMSRAYEPGPPAHIQPIGPLKLLSLKSPFVFVIQNQKFT